MLRFDDTIQLSDDNLDSEETDKGSKVTFSKTILSLIMFLYIIGAILGFILVIVSAILDANNSGTVDVSMFTAYGTYLAVPTATAIAFYSWKAKAENVLKIQNSFKKKQVLPIVETISKIGE